MKHNVTEKAHNNQENNFLILQKKKTNIFKKRWYKNVGMGILVPSEAIKGTYIDKKCPFIGNISIRGRIVRGTVVSTKMKKSVIVRRDYLHYVTKYKRFEKRHKNIACHCSPCFRVHEGDLVTIGQCRPLSKTIRFNLLRIDKQNNKTNKKK
nr:40S ribosomal protein S11 [Cryptomonas curvata]|mmetsp:Transcript_24927/g.52097  ORF Transcript_24927/g.52097 Transcript_24927/m.52097 type:complete len:152 (-) Transcript_24927:205-660(-)